LPSSVYDCSILPLSKIHNPAGNITIVESLINVPFDVKRVYYMYDIPGGVDRGGHAHYGQWQLIVAASGFFNVLLDDGLNKKIITLNRPDYGLLVCPGIWRDLIEFSSAAVCLVMVSEIYQPEDYIRDYTQFKAWKQWPA
jgi:dTDP-4-dehydrorhamnose 3,5-epimerase-like enzyme